MSIPRKIFTTWKEKDILGSQSPMILNGIGNVSRTSPTWTLEISDDLDMDYYIKSQLQNFDYNLIKNLKAAEKSDVWRLLKIYHEGGVYMDIDRFFNVDLDSVIDQKIKCFIPICNYTDFSQDILISEAGNPMYIEVLKQILHLRRAGVTNTYFLGPQTYLHVLSRLIVGKSIDTNPGQTVMNNLYHFINASTFMRSVIEHPPYDTFLYQHNPDKFLLGDRQLQDWQKIKEDFYGRYQVRHWTNLW